MTAIMWTLFVLAMVSLTFVVVAAVSGRRAPDSRHMALAVLTALLSVPFAMLAGGLSGLGLAGMSTGSISRVVLGGAGIVLLAAGFSPVLGLVVGLLRRRK